MLISRVFSVAVLVLLNSCAGSPDKPSESVKSTAAKVADMKEKARQKEAKTAIDPDVMFMLLAAEIAGQREQYDVALEGYMEAAKRVNDPRFAERAAVIAMYMKDGKKTQEAVSLWLKGDAKNPTARKIAALSALRSGDKQAAVEHLSTMLKADPAQFEDTLLELSSVLQKEGKLDVVYDTLTALSQKYPNQAAIYFVQSLLALQVKNGALAEQQIQKALRIQPDWDKALILQAQIAMLSGDANKAKAAIKNASLKYPNNDKIKKLLGQVLIKTESYKEAVDVYRQLVAANPKDAESKFTLGLVYLQLDQDEQAEDVLNQLLEQPDWKYQANFYLGKLAEKRKDIDKALAYFDKVTEGDFAFDAAIEAVSLLAKDKQFDAANARLSTLSSRFPKQKLRILLIQAETYSQQKQYQKAFDVLTAALAEQPDQQELLYTRALISEHLNRKDVLEKDLKQILAKDPDNVEALNALGYSLLDDPKRYAEAEVYLQKAVKLRPDEAVIIDSYGWLLFKQGRTQMALEYLQRAYTKQQENEIAAHIAEVLWALGRKAEAKKLFDKVIKDAPEDEYLLDFQRRILNKAK
ncbi:MAG: tetratricopeptide repeat protein [Methylococcales bacterium]|nr:tetratricopeptide repeat protein [Methylococcales bacterium]